MPVIINAFPVDSSGIGYFVERAAMLFIVAVNLPCRQRGQLSCETPCVID